MAEKPESKVVRIVNLGDSFTPEMLKDFIQQVVQLEGTIQNVYIRTYSKELVKLVYAYIIFDKSCDALKAVSSLNNYNHENTTFNVVLIGPTLPYTKYHTSSSIGEKSGFSKTMERIRQLNQGRGQGTTKNEEERIKQLNRYGGSSTRNRGQAYWGQQRIKRTTEDPVKKNDRRV